MELDREERDGGGGEPTAVVPLIPASQVPALLYTQERGFRVCEMVAWGKDLEVACQEVGLPNATAFLSWLMQQPELAIMFNLARQVSTYALEDEAVRVARGQYANPGDKSKLQAANQLLTHLRWVMAKRHPNVFSDRAEVNVTVPITIQTTLDLGDAAPGKGVKEMPNIYDLKGTITEHVNPDDLPKSALSDFEKQTGAAAWDSSRPVSEDERRAWGPRGGKEAEEEEEEGVNAARGQKDAQGSADDVLEKRLKKPRTRVKTGMVAPEGGLDDAGGEEKRVGKASRGKGPVARAEEGREEGIGG